MNGRLRKFSPWIILAVGLILSAGLILSKDRPERQDAPRQKIPVVRVEELSPRPYQIRIKAYGTTEPSQELALTPQVSGRVQSFASNLVEGGYVTKGQLLFQIDPIDFQLQLQQAKASMAKAEYDLDSVAAQKKAAIQGYQSFLQAQEPSQDKPLELSPLASFTPQLKNAQAALASAKANLQQAQLNLSRTNIKAPFSGYLRQVQIAVGQNLGVNQVVGQLFADRPIRLKVSLPLADLPWINFHGPVQKGSSVVLEKQIGPESHQWGGEVTHQLQEIDALGRMAQVMVEVTQPTSNLGFPLPLNLQLNVTIQGEILKEIYPIPLHALRAKDEVWLVEDRNRLVIRPVKILRKEKEFALVREGMNIGDLIVVSPLEVAISGMPVRIYGSMRLNGVEKTQGDHENH